MKTKWNLLVVLVMLALLLGGNVSPAQAAAGDLDTTFGTDGVLVTGTSPIVDYIKNQHESTQQSDGKIIVGGSYIPAIRIETPPQSELARYSADGVLDETFGTGGKIDPQPPGTAGSYIAGVYTGPGDEIIAIGGGYDATRGVPSQIFLARYDADGTPVAGYGTDGVLTFSLWDNETSTGMDLLPRSSAVQNDGKVLVSGLYDTYAGDLGAGTFLMRLNLADGTLDTDFGNNGMLLDVDAYVVPQITLQSDGNILLTKVMDISLSIHRLTSTGEPDTAFGSGGVLTLPMPSQIQFSMLAEGLEGDLYLTAGPIRESMTDDSDFFLAHLNADGSEDSTFGTGGFVFTDIAGNEDQSCGLLVQADGKVIVGGGAEDAIGNLGFALARFNADATLDESFGSAGTVITPSIPGAMTDLAMTPGGKLLATGLISDQGKFFTALARYDLAAQEPGLTIGPETLANAEYYTSYSQQLTAGGGTEPYTFSLVGGALPLGITLSSSGLLSGLAVGDPGTYPITVQVVDGSGVWATRAYDLVLDKGTPTVIARGQNFIYWGHPFTIWAEVKKEFGAGSSLLLNGTVAFSIDGTAVPGCGAVTQVNNSYFECTNVSMSLALGEHTVTADYTPTGDYAPYFNSASGTGNFTVQPGAYTVFGQLFKDLNQDGEYDEEDYSLGKSWTVNLDQDCDGTADYSITTDSIYSNFYFNSIPGGHCYRATVESEPGWQQTSQPADFWLSTTSSVFFGFYYPTITVSPSELPSGSVGVEYSQELTASGGAGPYTYSTTYGSLPDGLTLSEAGVLSGTPTQAGIFILEFQAEDTNGAAGSRTYRLEIHADAEFTFTSSANPSTEGEAVTFTVTAAGLAYHYYEGPIPPNGYVTFSADGIPIEGCSDVDINFSGQYGDYPATCTTAALSVGSHQITADFTDYYNIFNTATLSLTQVVQASVIADLSIANTDKTDPVKPGAKQVYTLTVTNAGPNTAESVQVTDRLDVNTSYVSISAPRGWTCKHAKGTVTCTRSSLASGQTATFTITVTVSKTVRNGKELINTAAVSSATLDPNTSNNSAVQKTLVKK